MKMSSIQVTKLLKSEHSQSKKCKTKCQTLTSGLEQPLRMALQAAYILCLCPFKLSSSSQNNHPIHYVIKRKWWQIVVCLFLFLCGFFWILNEIQNSMSKTDPRNPTLYFKTVASLLDTALKMVTIKQLWCNQKQIVHIINYAANHGRVNSSKGARLLKLVSAVLIFFYVGKGIVFWMSGPRGGFGSSRLLYSDSKNETDDVGISAWWHQVVIRGQQNFFLDKNYSSASKANMVEVVVGGLAALGYFYRRMLGSFTDLFVIMNILTLQRATQRFTDFSNFQDIDARKWKLIREEYWQLKQLSGMINTLVGTNVSCIILVTILIGATSLHEIFFRPRGNIIIHGASLLGFLATCIAVLNCCMDVTRRVRKSSKQSISCN